MNTPEENTEIPISTVLPWIILYAVVELYVLSIHV